MARLSAAAHAPSDRLGLAALDKRNRPSPRVLTIPAVGARVPPCTHRLQHQTPPDRRRSRRATRAAGRRRVARESEATSYDGTTSYSGMTYFRFNPVHGVGVGWILQVFISWFQKTMSSSSSPSVANVWTAAPSSATSAASLASILKRDASRCARSGCDAPLASLYRP